jgi:hypothetical protein
MRQCICTCVDFYRFVSLACLPLAREVRCVLVAAMIEFGSSFGLSPSAAVLNKSLVHVRTGSCVLM